MIALRLMRLAGGGALAFREATRMIGEKVDAAAEAQLAAAMALAVGQPARALDHAASAYARRIRANRRRLTPS